MKLPFAQVSESDLANLSPRLKILHLNGASGVRSLVFAQKYRLLRELNIQLTGLKDLEKLYHLSGLKVLEISKVDMKAKKVKKLHALEKLIIHSSRWQRKEVKYVARSNFSKVSISFVFDEDEYEDSRDFVYYSDFYESDTWLDPYKGMYPFPSFRSIY